MNRLNHILLFFIIAAAMSCVDPLNVNIDRDERILVIEGHVTTEPKVHTISITRSAKYGTIFEGVIRNVVSAQVILRDENGVVTEFEESSSGRYSSPPDFSVEVGKTYTLEIILNTGDRYMTFPETVPPVPEIDSIIPVFRKIPTGIESVFTTGLEIYSQYEDPPDEKNYYWWEMGGTYYLKTYPEDFVARPPFGPPTPAPKDCCGECWIREGNIDTRVRIANDFLTDGRTSTELAGFLEDDGRRFNEKYLLRLKQFSQTREAHQFFKLIKDQLEIDGDIFDAPPGQVRGNFYKVDDYDQEVLGYFWLGDVKTDSIFISNEVLVEPQALERIADDCRLESNSTTVRPLYW